MFTDAQLTADTQHITINFLKTLRDVNLLKLKQLYDHFQKFSKIKKRAGGFNKTLKTPIFDTFLKSLIVIAALQSSSRVG